MAWDQTEITRWQRNARAMVASAASNDCEAFAELVRLVDELATSGLQEAARGLRASGYSWAEIAAPLGVKRQSAHARFAG